MHKIKFFIGCLVLCFEIVNIDAQSICDSLRLVDFTYKQARDIRITKDIIFFRKCNDTSSREIKIASKAINAVIINGKIINIDHETSINIDHETRTRWTFTRKSDEKKFNVFKGDKISLKLSIESKQKRINGILENLNTDSIYIVDKKKGVIAISKQAVTSIKLPKSGSTAAIIALISILLFFGGMLYGLSKLQISINIWNPNPPKKNYEAGAGGFLIVLGLIGIISLFFIKKDPEIKDPFGGAWRFENNIKESEP